MAGEPRSDGSRPLLHRGLAFRAPTKDSSMYPGMRTGATEQWFSSIWLHIRITWGEFLKIKMPTAKQRSQNLQKRNLSVVFFSKLFWMPWYPVRVGIITINNLGRGAENRDLNPFLIAWLCKSCMAGVGPRVMPRRPSGVMEMAQAWEVMKETEDMVLVLVCYKTFAMWCRTSQVDLSGSGAPFHLLIMATILVFFRLSSLTDALLVFILWSEHKLDDQLIYSS